jgi:hypothetical protein
VLAKFEPRSPLQRPGISTRGTESDSIQVGLVELHAGNDQLNSALPTAASLAADCLNGNGLLDGSRVMASDHGDAADSGVLVMVATGSSPARGCHRKDVTNEQLETPDALPGLFIGRSYRASRLTPSPLLNLTGTREAHKLCWLEISLLARSSPRLPTGLTYENQCRFHAGIYHKCEAGSDYT